MGKVQDTLVKLAGRTDPACPGLTEQLYVPSQQPPGADSFAVEPSAVSSWLDRHRPFDRAENIRALTTALQHSNRLQTPASERRAIMALYEAPVRWALAILGARHAESALPASADATRDFNAMSVLQQEMANGYKLALIDTLQDREAATQCEQLLASAMRHLSACCLRHWRAYARWPKNRWRDLHALYAIAVQRQCADATTQDQPSVRSGYLKLCAMAISQPHRLQPSQLLTLDAFLDSTVPRLLDVDTHDQATPAGSYVTIAGTDSAPIPASFAPASRLLAKFDVSSLLDNLDDLLIGDTTPGSALNRSTQNRLHQIWLGRTRRQLPRAVRAKTVAIETGLRNLHAVMSYHSPASEPLAKDLDEVDLGHFLDPSSRPPQPVRNALRPGDYGAQWVVCNDTRRGLGLRWTGKGRCRMQVGELVGHTYRDERGLTHWHMGVCRWLDGANADPLICGIETISTSAIAVMLHCQDPTDEQIGDAILLNHSATATGPAMLVMAKGQFDRSQRIGIVSANRVYAVTLAERINLSNRFDCFGVAPIAEHAQSTGHASEAALTV